MPLHRLVTPTYPGGLPGTHDLINDGAVSDAPADGQKASGDNQNTYFVAFGEDATSAYANRPHKALAENTDFIDDIVSGALPVPAELEVTAPGGVVPKVQLTGDVFVGLTSYSDTQQFRDKLIKVVDPATGNELLDINDDPIAVSAIKNSADASNIVGGEATGFHTDPWVYFGSSGIQAGQDYKLLFCKRGTLKEAVVDKTYQDMLPRLFMDGAPKVAGEVERFMHEASRRSGNIEALAASILETPGIGDNIRPKSATLILDVDPDGSLSNRSLRMRVDRDGTPLTPFMVTEEPALAGGTYVWDTAEDALYVRDGNMDANEGPHPFTSGTASEGDQGLLRMEVPDPTAPPTLFKQVNARWTITVGDGVESFGDFNGNDAIQDAIDYWLAQHTTTEQELGLRILLKPGTYTPTATISLPIGADGRDLIIEGTNRESCTIVNDLAAGVGLFSNVSTMQECRLGLRELKLKAASGGASNFAMRLYNARLRMSRVDVTGINHGQAIELIYNSNAGITNPKTGIVFCDECYFAANAVAEPTLRLQVAWPEELRGFLFRDCRFSVSDSPPLELKSGDPSAAASLNEIRFEGCRFELPSTGETTGNWDLNSGLCELVVGATNDNLTVGDITWKDAVVDVAAGSAGDSPLVMYMRTSTGTRSLPVNKVVFDGLQIFLPDQDPILTPFYIGGTTWDASPNVNELIFHDVVIVRDVAAALVYGAPPTELSATTADFAAFTLNARDRLDVREVTVLNSNGDANVGEFSFRAFGDGWGGELFIDGITMKDWLDGSPGTKPTSLINVTVDGWGRGIVRRVEVDLHVNTLASPADQVVLVTKAPTAAFYMEKCNYVLIQGTNIDSVVKVTTFSSNINVTKTWITGCRFSECYGSIADIHILTQLGDGDIREVFIEKNYFLESQSRSVVLEVDVSGANNPINAHITNNYMYASAKEGLYLMTADWLDGTFYGKTIITSNTFEQCGAGSTGGNRCVASYDDFYGIFNNNIMTEPAGGKGLFAVGNFSVGGGPGVMAWNQRGMDTTTLGQLPPQGAPADMLFNAGQLLALSTTAT